MLITWRLAKSVAFDVVLGALVLTSRHAMTLPSSRSLSSSLNCRVRHLRLSDLGHFHRFPGVFSIASRIPLSPGRWLAQGTIRGDTLTVSYNDAMLWNDFEDGHYVRASSRAR